MGTRKLKVGSRDSKLAVIQARMIMEEIKRNFPEYDLELITMKTTGDNILDRTLAQIGGKGLFTKELDQGLRQGIIDITVHSLKDLPAEIPEDLPIVAVTEREDPRDVLVLPGGGERLEPAQALGCSSARRRIQLQNLDRFKGFTVEPVRGNVLTRLRKLDEGQYGALILAYAGLIRLGLKDRSSYIFRTEEILPAAGQGILAVQGRKGEDHRFLDCIRDEDAVAAATAEREFIRTLDGGCSAPIAAYASVAGDEIKLTGLYVEESAGVRAQGSITGIRSEGRRLGQELALRLLNEVNQSEQ